MGSKFFFVVGNPADQMTLRFFLFVCLFLDNVISLFLSFYEKEEVRMVREQLFMAAITKVITGINISIHNINFNYKLNNHDILFIN